MNIKVGKTYKLFWYEGNINNKTIHIRAFVDDQIVYRYWSKRKQSWYYKIDTEYFFYLLEREGVIKNKKMKPIRVRKEIK